MTDAILQGRIEAARGNQDQLVPALMEVWAPRVAEAAGIRPGHRVLDVACGEADLRGWLPLVGIVLEEKLIEDILREAEGVLKPFVTDDGTSVSFASPALLATAAKPITS